MRISDCSSDVCSSDLHRRFREATGVSPAAFARQRRTARAQKALSLGKPVTDAIYDAGYAAPSRFYAEAEARLGMEPSAWRNGGRGVTIRSEEHTSELQSLMRSSYAVFCLKKKNTKCDTTLNQQTS